LVRLIYFFLFFYRIYLFLSFCVSFLIINFFHRRALALGASDEGAPGPRPFAPNAYAAYIRDLDGHKIAASCRQPG
jgi:hypothetical protein